MVTYCIGSARQKRAYFAESDAVVLDNVEVLFCVDVNGKNYFAVGDPPFGTFTVAEYLAYRRALCADKVDAATVREFGLDPNKRLARLAPAEMRIVTFLEKTCGATDKAVVINLDGARFSRRNKRALDILVAAVTDAYVCVSDRKFLKAERGAVKILSFGKKSIVCASRPRAYKAKILAKRVGAKRVAVF